MLSPGKYHLQVPRDPVGNRRFRVATLERCKTDKVLRAGLLEMCWQDILFWVNVFGWQFNPKKKKGNLEVGPFITWDFQEDALMLMLRCVEEDDDLLIEKSREMGASWLIIFLFSWLLNFRRHQTLLLISRNEKAVESESQDSLFWKLDFIHSFLPAWLLPQGLNRRKLYVSNPWTESAISGEATTEKAGVGGRATAIAIDEFSQIKEDRQILSRTSDTSDCRIFNGTHKGMGTAMYELSKRPDMRKLQMHWSQHPDKVAGLYRYHHENQSIEVLDKSYKYQPDFQFVMDGTPTGGPFPGLRSPWYDKQCLRKAGERDVAMDLDINPEGTVEQFFNPITLRGLRDEYCMAPLWTGDLDYDDQFGTPRSLLSLPNGRLKLWIKPTVRMLVPFGEYVLGADVATGSGATPSCLAIANRNTGEKVGEYANPFIEPKEFAVFCVAVARLFQTEDKRPAMFIWEIPGPGYTVGVKVLELGFREIFWKTNEFSLGKKESDQPGWYGSNENRETMLRDYRSALYTRQFLNRAADSLMECLKFSYNKQGLLKHATESTPNDPSGAKQNHGDQVIADALACKMCLRRHKRHGEDEPHEEVQQGSLAWRRQLVAQRERSASNW